MNLPPRNRSFVGRTSLLAEVDRLLDDDTHRPRAVALSGLAGVGKTELALEVAHRRHREGRVAWWIGADDPAAIASGLADLAAAAGITQYEREQDTREALWCELDRNPGWVLVFDNADEPHQLEPYLPRAQHGDVIITSHNPAWRRLARPISLPPLARAESIEFALARSGDRDRTGADALAGMVGDLPLALTGVPYIEQTACRCRIRAVFRRAATCCCARRGTGPTIATTWGLPSTGRGPSRWPRSCGDHGVPGPGRDRRGRAHTAGRRRAGTARPIGELLRLSLVDRRAAAAHEPACGRLGKPAAGPVRRERFSRGQALRRRPARRRGCAAWAAHLVVLAGHGESLGLVRTGWSSRCRAGPPYAARALYRRDAGADAALRRSGGPRADRACRRGGVGASGGGLRRRRRLARHGAAPQGRRDAERAGRDRTTCAAHATTGSARAQLRRRHRRRSPSTAGVGCPGPGGRVDLRPRC